MSTRVVSEFAGVVVATNNLKICTSASVEARVNAAAFTQEMLVAGATELSGTGVTDSGGFSLFRRPEGNATRYSVNQRIIAGEPAVSQNHRVTDIQRSYVECDGGDFS